MQTKVDKQGILDVIEKYNEAEYPKRNRIKICHGHGCKYASDFRITDSIIAELRELFEGVSSPSMERDALKKSVAFLERESGKVVGTQHDKPSLSFIAGGRFGQMDCVDEALNSTSYLVILNRLGLIKFHDIKAPVWKGGFFKWTHYAALIEDKETRIRWAIDSGVRENGKEPLIIEYERWYE